MECGSSISTLLYLLENSSPIWKIHEDFCLHMQQHKNVIIKDLKDLRFTELVSVIYKRKHTHKTQKTKTLFLLYFSWNSCSEYRKHLFYVILLNKMGEGPGAKTHYSCGQQPISDQDPILSPCGASENRQ